jgi:ABC-2 type transport system ATP-binding protein
MNKENALITQGLTKQYQAGKTGKVALDHLDLSVNRGEIFGYLGPNGAGKTTTIRLLLDIIRPTSGSAHVLGMDAQKDAVALHRRIGYLPGELNLWDGLTGQQVVNYLGRIRGGVDSAYVKQLTDRLALDLTKRVRSYSTGNRRKLGLVLALMHKPELLILDEPTNGLDPLMQLTFHEMMREVKAEGRTVFLSSHILSEVQAICERVAILRDGKLQAVQRVADLTTFNFSFVRVRTAETLNPARLAQLQSVPGLSEFSAEANTLKFRLAGDFDPVLRALSGEYIVNIHTSEPTLEDIFLTFYGNNGNNGNHIASSVSNVSSVDSKVREAV